MVISAQARLILVRAESRVRAEVPTLCISINLSGDQLLPTADGLTGGNVLLRHQLLLPDLLSVGAQLVPGSLQA